MPSKKAATEQQVYTPTQEEMMGAVFNMISTIATQSARIDPISAKILENIIQQNDRLITILAELADPRAKQIAQEESIDRNFARMNKINLINMMNNAMNKGAGCNEEGGCCIGEPKSTIERTDPDGTKTTQFIYGDGDELAGPHSAPKH